MRFRKNPVVVEAFQVTNDLLRKAQEADFTFGTSEVYFDGESVRVVTIEGTMRAKVGDWIVGPGAEGEYWPVKKSIFEKTYEPAEASENRLAAAFDALRKDGIGLTLGQETLLREALK